MEPEGWRALMDTTRAVARTLALEGSIAITRGDQVLDPETFKGICRLRLKNKDEGGDGGTKEEMPKAGEASASTKGGASTTKTKRGEDAVEDATHEACQRRGKVAKKEEKVATPFLSTDAGGAEES